MIREEYITAAGVSLERLVLCVRDLPDDRFALPLGSDAESVHALFADLSARAERTVRALELLYQGVDFNVETMPSSAQAPAFKQTFANFRIGHTTLLAALERIPLARFSADGELPQWLLSHYLEPLQDSVPRVESWAGTLRSTGHAGPTGLPVIQ